MRQMMVKSMQVRQLRKRLEQGANLRVELLGRAVPAIRTAEGIRALSNGKPVSPESVERYLEAKFGEALPDGERALRTLAWALPPEELARRAFELYEHFRPEVPPGRQGWGAAGTLDLGLILTLARAARTTRTRVRRDVGRRSHWTAPESRVAWTWSAGHAVGCPAD